MRGWRVGFWLADDTTTDLSFCNTCSGEPFDLDALWQCMLKSWRASLYTGDPGEKILGVRRDFLHKEASGNFILAEAYRMPWATLIPMKVTE